MHCAMIFTQGSARGALSELPRIQPSLLGRVGSLRHDTSHLSENNNSQLQLALATTATTPVSDLSSREKGAAGALLRGGSVLSAQPAVQGNVSGAEVECSNRREAQRSPPPMPKRHRGSVKGSRPAGGGSDVLLPGDDSIPAALSSATEEVLTYTGAFDPFCFSCGADKI